MSIITTIELLEQEARCFAFAMEAVARQLQAENRKESDVPHVAAVFTKDGSFALKADSDAHGFLIRLLVYKMEQIRQMAFPPEKLLVIYLEELCHALWGISDELKVKHKVAEVFSGVMGKKYRVDELYDANWLREEAERQMGSGDS